MNLLRLMPVAVCAGVAVLATPLDWPHLQVPGARHTELCRLELKPGNAFTRVGPPAMPEQSRLAALAGPPSLNITYTGFSPQAQAAFAHAASIVETQLRSRVQFKVSARMETLSSAGVLGFASTGVLTPGNWTPAEGGVPPPIFNAFYPFPLADHLQNRDTTDPEFFPQHFVVTLNTTPNWYFGTDGAPAAGQVDFVSVALHEIVHAVGFAGQARVITASNENWSCPSPPCGSVLLEGTATATSLGFSAAFEYFTKTVSGVALRDSTAFPHLSQTLANQLTQAYDPAAPRGNGVYFDGPFTTHGNGGLSARLYTPNPFAGGSSIGHVDEEAYPAGHVNSLMSPFLSAAEAVHAIGPVALGVLADTGWGADVCAIKLGSLTQTVPREAGTTTLRIRLPSFCGWSLVNSASFLTVSGSSTGTGSATVSFSRAANTGAPRTGLVTVNGVPHQVSQGNADVAAAIHASPESVTVTAGQSATFTAIAGGDPPPTLRWQLSTDGGSTFTDLTEGSTYTGVTTADLTVNAATAAMNGHRLRAVASNGIGAAAASAAASLAVLHAPIVTTAPSDRLVDVGTATTFSVAGTANPAALTYQWQRSSDGGVTWTNVVEGSPYSFPTSPTLEVVAVSSVNGTRFRCRVTNAVGTTASAAAVLTVRSFVTLVPSTLRFGGSLPAVGAALTSTTGSQTLRVQFDAAPGAWTLTSNVPWVVVTGGSGGGNAQVTVSIAPGATLPQGENQAALTFTSAMATNSGFAASVTLTAVLATQPAFGSFDTPLEGATGVTGSIAVTGWAVDDVDVTGVRILRDPVAGEPAGTPIFIGHAVLVDGARPDIQTAFPAMPRNSRAGWGYLMLTNFLPNLGNGTFRLHAVADDAEGHSTTLGTRTITCTNSTATAPFGAIDTPGQGETVTTGSYNNFGWVLSPGSRRSDPPNGGTVQVVIDGVLGVTPSGWVSRSDLDALFPAAQFSGIGNALGVATLNMAALTNGVHTISWLVTDNQGSASGIGSRYFTVANSALTLAPDLRLPTMAAAPARSVAGRRGYAAGAPYQTYTAGPDGRITIHAEEIDRVELQLGAPGSGARSGETFSGHLRVGDALHALPAGSALDRSTGEFTWQPGVGFVGSYDLVFARWDEGSAVERHEVRIVLNPKGTHRSGPQTIIDAPSAGSIVTGPFVLAGWAADLDAVAGAGMNAVHVWAYPVNDRGTYDDAIWIGAAGYGGARQDVAAIHGARFRDTGYGITVRGLAPGTYDLAVFSYSTVRHEFMPAKTVRIVVPNPR